MDDNRLTEIVNKLADMLIEHGVDAAEICDELDLTEYEAYSVGLRWLIRQAGWYEDDE
ncbi:MAG: hypothetical protein J6Y20_10100 [Lachnospiraceae bacterium]|nr:hypothetical protein [Lachnospiraceae bacterium]MBP5462465.1 hypothetical protein [Lachnospiraceae bacterium]